MGVQPTGAFAFHVGELFYSGSRSRSRWLSEIYSLYLLISPDDGPEEHINPPDHKTDDPPKHSKQSNKDTTKHPEWLAAGGFEEASNHKVSTNKAYYEAAGVNPDHMDPG